MVVKETYSHRVTETIYTTKNSHLQEIHEILNSVALADRRADVVNREIKEAFKSRNWSTEERVLEDAAYRYDAYKDGVAVEVELSLHAYTYRDYMKFLIGQRVKKTDVGVLVIRHESIQMDVAQATFARATSDLRIFSPILTVPILVIGLT